MSGVLLLPLAIAALVAASRTLAGAIGAPVTERVVRRAAERAVLNAMRRDEVVRAAILHAARLGGYTASNP